MYCWSGCWFFKKHFEAIHVLYSVQWDSWILCGKKHFKSTDSSSASTGKILGPSFIQVGAKVQCRIPVSVIQAVQCCAENWAPSASQQGAPQGCCASWALAANLKLGQPGRCMDSADFPEVELLVTTDLVCPAVIAWRYCWILNLGLENQFLGAAVLCWSPSNS